MTLYIQKRSGMHEPFMISKVRRSLERSGLSNDMIEEIIVKIHKNPPKTTKDLHTTIINFLNQRHHGSLAARYNLKTALFELGPDGFLFEKFMSYVLEALGFTVKTNVIVQGDCVDHEVDIIAYDKDISYFVECKFHIKQGIKSNIKTPLYVQARFEDIKKRHEKEHNDQKTHSPWCVTNTDFTEQAHAYAACQRMRMLDWRYPENDSLAKLIERYGLYPITALTTLSRSQKEHLMQEGLILCKDIRHYEYLFKKLHITPEQFEVLAQEAHVISHSVKKT